MPATLQCFLHSASMGALYMVPHGCSLCDMSMDAFYALPSWLFSTWHLTGYFLHGSRTDTFHMVPACVLSTWRWQRYFILGSMNSQKPASVATTKSSKIYWIMFFLQLMSLLETLKFSFCFTSFCNFYQTEFCWHRHWLH